MLGLHSKVAAFSKDLRRFTHDIKEGVEDIKRSAKSKPCIEREAPHGYPKDFCDQHSNANETVP